MDIMVAPKYRALLFPCTDIGTVLENNATILDFLIPSELDKYPDRQIVIVNSTGSYLYSLKSNSVVIPKEATLVPNAEIQLICTNSDNEEWRSQAYNVNFYNSIDDSGDNIVSKSKEEQRETDRSELGNAVALATSNSDDKDKIWDDLIQTVKELEPKQFGEIVELIYNKLWGYYKEWHTEINPETGGDILND